MFKELDGGRGRDGEVYRGYGRLRGSGSISWGVEGIGIRIEEVVEKIRDRGGRVIEGLGICRGGGAERVPEPTVPLATESLPERVGSGTEPVPIPSPVPPLLLPPTLWEGKKTATPDSLRHSLSLTIGPRRWKK